MALLKEIRQPDGVVTSYHRILQLIHTTNSHNSISVISYVDKESRDSDGTDSLGNRPYRSSITYEIDYDESMNMEKAYDYLKTLPEFEGYEDA